MKHKNSPQVKKIAAERIEKLFSEAEKQFKIDSGLSDRYVHIARRMAMKYKISLPSYLKRRVCRKCHKFLVPGSNARVRLKDGMVTYYCLSCKHYMRFPYIREKKAKS